MLLPTLAFGADTAVRIETTPTAKINYPWVTFLTEGPAGWASKNEQAKIQGKVLRFVFYRGPEEMPSTYRIEEITFGTEGCCRALRSAREFKLVENIGKVFGPTEMKDAEEFEFVRWRNASSVEIKYFGRAYLISNLDQRVVTVTSVRK
jgi:hypothetical protein